MTTDDEVAEFQQRIIKKVRSVDPPFVSPNQFPPEAKVVDDPFKHLDSPRTSLFEPSCEGVNDIPGFLRGFL